MMGMGPPHTLTSDCIDAPAGPAPSLSPRWEDAHPDQAAQPVILLVEDDPCMLVIMEGMLRDFQARIVTAECMEQAVEYLRGGPIDMVVTDINLGGGSGLTLLEQVHDIDRLVPVILITGSHELDLAVHAIRHGADDYVVKPFGDQDLRDGISRGLAKRQRLLRREAYQAGLETQVQQRTQELQQMVHHLEATYRATLQALGAALDTRDVQTFAHSERVAQYALLLGRTLNMAPSALTTLERGVFLHDIGKIGIPDRILLKQEALTPDEWQIMKQHCQLGYRLASQLTFLDGAAEIILAHHERYDGSGYPFGLKGDGIPYGARVFAVVDAFDAITSDRPYSSARPFGYAREEIARSGGRQFDPVIVDAFLSVPDATLKEIRESARPSSSVTGARSVSTSDSESHGCGSGRPAIP